MGTIAPPEGNRCLLLLRCEPVGFASIRHVQCSILNFARLYLIGQYSGMNLMDQSKLFHANGAWRWLDIQARGDLREIFRVRRERSWSDISGQVERGGMFGMEQFQYMLGIADTAGMLAFDVVQARFERSQFALQMLYRIFQVSETIEQSMWRSCFLTLQEGQLFTIDNDAGELHQIIDIDLPGLSNLDGGQALSSDPITDTSLIASDQQSRLYSGNLHPIASLLQLTTMY